MIRAANSSSGARCNGSVNISVQVSWRLLRKPLRSLQLPTALFASPLAGGAGTVVTIIGTNLSNVTSVLWRHRLTDIITINSPTQITAVIRKMAGEVSRLVHWLVRYPLRCVYLRSGTKCAVYHAQSGAAGTVVTIVGTNLTVRAV